MRNARESWRKVKPIKNFIFLKRNNLTWRTTYPHDFLPAYQGVVATHTTERKDAILQRFDRVICEQQRVNS